TRKITVHRRTRTPADRILRPTPAEAAHPHRGGPPFRGAQTHRGGEPPTDVELAAAGARICDPPRSQGSDTAGSQLRAASRPRASSDRSAVLTGAAGEASSLTSDAGLEDGPRSGISPSSTTSLIWDVWAISPFSIAVFTTSSFS